MPFTSTLKWKDDNSLPITSLSCTSSRLAKLLWVHMGFGIHGKVVNFGYESNNHVRNALINFHSNCEVLSIVRALFLVTTKTNVVAWSTMAAGYVRLGNLGV